MPQYTPTTVQVDAYPDAFFHAITTEVRWNGFACPLFPLEEAKRLALINNASEGSGHLLFNKEQDCFCFWQAGQSTDEPPEIFEATVIDGVAYYAIGAFDWCWTVRDDDAARFSFDLMRELLEMRKLGMRVPDKALTLAATPSVVREHASARVSEAADLLINLADISSPAESSPLSVYQRFLVEPVVALDANGETISLDDLTEIPAVTHETASESDPNVSAWGVYGLLFDSSVDHVADCASKAIAEGVADALNFRFGRP